jgi:hypothetical protein
MAYARAMHNSVVLPNGQVVVIGGQGVPVPFSDDLSVLAPELWDPATESFTTLAPMQTPRNYHSVALLLLDGRVLAGGGGLCGSCSTNHANVEILTPPYLLNADGSAATRPSITSAPATATLGTQISVATNSAITSFALVRMGTSTHSIDTDQRRVPVTFSSSGSNAYSVAIPSDPGVVLPGYWMLFALNGSGVPSVAKSILISAGTSQPPPTTIAPGAFCSNQGSNCRFSGSRVVSFGTNSQFVDKLISKKTACTTAVFGDPAPGQTKACYTSKLCASEGSTCTFSGTKVVHYGAGNSFVSKVFTGSVFCDSSVFGDPAFGASKSCYVNP